MVCAILRCRTKRSILHGSRSLYVEVTAPCDVEVVEPEVRDVQVEGGGVVLLGEVNNFALEELGDVEEDCEGEDRQEVAEEMMPVAGRVHLAPGGYMGIDVHGHGTLLRCLVFYKDRSILIFTESAQKNKN